MAKTLDEGLYYVLSRFDEHGCIEVVDDSDSNKADVRLFVKDGGDAEKWHVNYIDSQDAYQISAPLTGRVMGWNKTTSTHGNVRQESDTNAADQRWKIVDSGQTYSFTSASGTVFNDQKLYYICPNNSQSLRVTTQTGKLGDITVSSKQKGDGSKKAFTLPEVMHENDKVTSVTVGGEAKQEGTHYTVSISNNKGTVTFKTAPEKNARIVIKYTTSSSITVESAQTEVTSQLWMFVPISYMWPGTGVYEIVSALNEDLVVDVASGSKSNGASVVLHARNREAHQKFYITHTDQGTIQFRPCHSKKAIADTKVGKKAGNAVTQEAYAAEGPKQTWLATNSHYRMKIGTVSYNLYNVALVAGDGLVLDAKWKAGVSGEHIYVNQKESSVEESQLWAFVPSSSPLSKVWTPADLEVRLEDLAEDDDPEPGFNGRTSVPMMFRSSWSYTNLKTDDTDSKFQIRCRFRTKGKSGEWRDWCDWRDAKKGLTGNDGWGDAWKESGVRITKKGKNKRYFDLTIPDDFVVDGVKVYHTQVQVQVRCFGEYVDPDIPFSHGNPCSATFRMDYKPTTVTLGDAVSGDVRTAYLSGSGLEVPFHSSSLETGVAARVIGTFSKDGTSFSVTQWGSDLEATEDTVLIPPKKLLFVPTISATPIDNFNLKLYTRRPPSAISEKLAVTARSKFLDIDPLVRTSKETGVVEIGIPILDKKDEIELYMTGEEGPILVPEIRRVFKTNEKYAYYYCFPNATTNLWMRRNDGTWTARNVAVGSNTDYIHYHQWIYDGGACFLDLNTEYIVHQEDNITRSSNNYEVLNRKYPTYRLKDIHNRTLDVEGVVTGEYAPEMGDWNSFDKLLEAGHAIYKNPRGEILSVVVTGVQRTLDNPLYTNIHITQVQETR